MCSRDNLRFNLILKINHPTVLETVQMRVPCNALCVGYCCVPGNSELSGYQYLGLQDSNLFHVAAYVRELGKVAPLRSQLAQQFP